MVVDEGIHRNTGADISQTPLSFLFLLSMLSVLLFNKIIAAFVYNKGFRYDFREQGKGHIFL